MNDEVSYYINCSGAKKRKKKIKKKEKVDVFLIREKVIEHINIKIDQIKNDIQQKLKKIASYKIPYGIDEKKVEKLLLEYNISQTKIKEVTYYEIKTDIESVESMKESIEELPMEVFIYQVCADKIVNRTKELLDTPVKINFFNKKQAPNNDEKELESLKQEMIELSKKYIDFTEEKEQIEQCDCGNSEMIEDNAEQICVNCGKTKFMNITLSCFADNERVSYSQKYKYKKINHFKDTIRQFQGIQNKHIDKKVLVDLKDALEKDKIIDQSLVNPYYKLTKEHLRIYMDHTGHNKYYEDINLIFNHFTGRECPTISEDIYSKIIEDFEKLVQMFISISSNEDKIERTNFLNSQYVLYQLLKRYNYHCVESDFALPRSIKCRVDQENIFIMLCDKLHWSYISIL